LYFRTILRMKRRERIAKEKRVAEEVSVMMNEEVEAVVVYDVL
jgi:hypothetical protein